MNTLYIARVTLADLPAGVAVLVVARSEAEARASAQYLVAAWSGCGTIAVESVQVVAAGVAGRLIGPN